MPFILPGQVTVAPHLGVLTALDGKSRPGHAEAGIGPAGVGVSILGRAKKGWEMSAASEIVCNLTLSVP